MQLQSYSNIALIFFYSIGKLVFDFGFLFNGISTLMCYLMQLQSYSNIPLIFLQYR